MTNHEQSELQHCPDTSMALFLIGEAEKLPLQWYYDAADLLRLPFRGIVLARWQAQDAGHTELNLARGIHQTVTPEGYAHLATLPEEIRQQVKEVIAALVQPPEPEIQ